MQNYNSYNKILTDENLMETIHHGSNKYPFRYYYDELKSFDFSCIEWHWHAELEFIYIEHGPIMCNVGEHQFELNEGMGIFINSKVLHRFYSKQEGIMPNFLFMPEFIAPTDSLIYEKYVYPIISSSMEYQIFHPEAAWHKDVLELMKKIIVIQESNKEKELHTSYLVQRIWELIFMHTEITTQQNPLNHKNGEQARLQMMMQYIHENYSSRITLDELSEYIMVSKSTVLNLFQKYLHTTPIKYLNNYRLQEAARLLRITENKVTAIAADTGFENGDYFCRKFKEYYQLTPGQYRKKYT